MYEEEVRSQYKDYLVTSVVLSSEKGVVLSIITFVITLLFKFNYIKHSLNPIPILIVRSTFIKIG